MKQTINDNEWRTRGEKRNFRTANVGGGNAIVNDGSGETGSVGQCGSGV